MEVRIDPCRPNGEHGDKPTHKVVIGADDKGTVAIRIEDADTRAESPLVEVNAHALFHALLAIMWQESDVWRKDAEFHARHRPRCPECSGFKAAESAR